MRLVDKAKDGETMRRETVEDHIRSFRHRRGRDPLHRAARWILLGQGCNRGLDHVEKLALPLPGSLCRKHRYQLFRRMTGPGVHVLPPISLSSAFMRVA